MTTVLDAIRAREQAATPGPWEVSRETIGPCDDEIITYTIWSARDKRGSRWAVADSGNPQMAEFIAHARADMPLLLAVAEAAAEWRQAELDWTTINDEFQAYDGDIAGLNEIADRMCATEESIEALKDTLMTAIAPLVKEEAE